MYTRAFVIFCIYRSVCKRLLSWILLPKEPNRAIHAAIHCSVVAPAGKEKDSSTYRV